MEMKDLIYAAVYSREYMRLTIEGMDSKECDYYADTNASIVSNTYSFFRQKEKDPGNEGV